MLALMTTQMQLRDKEAAMVMGSTKGHAMLVMVNALYAATWAGL